MTAPQADEHPEQLDDRAARPELVHADDCPGAAVVKHETARTHHYVCRGCQAWHSTPRRPAWDRKAGR